MPNIRAQALQDVKGRNAGEIDARRGDLLEVSSSSILATNYLSITFIATCSKKPSLLNEKLFASVSKAVHAAQKVSQLLVRFLEKNKEK